MEARSPEAEPGALRAGSESAKAEADSADAGVADSKSHVHTRRSVCLGVSGSVAAVKAPELAHSLLLQGVDVDVVVSESAYKLMHASYRDVCPWSQLVELSERYRSKAPEAPESAPRPALLPAESCAVLRVWRDSDEWENYRNVGTDQVLHIELAKRNQLLLIAPLCANTLADAALGRCGSLLTSVLRAWSYDLEDSFGQALEARFGVYAVRRPVLVAPAMNTLMYHQCITGEHLSTLKARGIQVVPPVVKRLACGDTGMGAMAHVSDIAGRALELLEQYMRDMRAALAHGHPPFEL